MNWEKLTNTQLDEFLQINGTRIPETRDQKKLAAELLLQKSVTEYTIPIINLFLASQVINPYQKYQFDILGTASLRQLAPLLKVFGLNIVESNRSRLIDILDFAGAIEYGPDYFESLPDELLQIILNRLSDRELDKICTISKKIYNLCSRKEFWHQRYDMYVGEENFSISFPTTWRKVIPVSDISSGETGKIRIYERETILQLYKFLVSYFGDIRNLAIYNSIYRTTYFKIHDTILQRFIGMSRSPTIFGHEDWIPVIESDKLENFQSITSITLS